MTLLITGAMGHVGFAVARKAAADGRQIVAQYRSQFQADEAATLGGNVKWVRCDLDDASAVADMVRENAITACLHSAAVANEAFARPEPRRAIETNIGATANLLDAARLGGWRRFVMVSTGSVFQLRKDTTASILEDAAPEPANVYSTTKVAAEMMVRMYRSEYQVSASSVRISWVYGPPIITDHLMRGPIPSYLMRSLNGVAIDEGGGDFAASFTYIEDVAGGLLAALDAPALNHAVYHLGSGVNYSVQEVAAAVRKACPKALIKTGPGTEPWTTYTAMRGPLAGDRLKADTAFVPAHGLVEGIEAYAEWLQANVGAG
ncbi:MAG: NAD(P)-dependent oxidoreductase [Hyphomicrobiaceae bacterium]